jgi:membrane-associated protein
MFFPLCGDGRGAGEPTVTLRKDVTRFTSSDKGEHLSSSAVSYDVPMLASMFMSPSMFMSLGALGLDPEKLIGKYGLVGIAIIVFAETGLLIGFFLPGDSLLFTAGILAAADKTATVRLDQPIWLIVLVIMAMAIIGDQVGYRIGTKAGPALFDKPKSRLFNPTHVERAQGFFDHHGPKAIVLARFVPIVRTFTPVIAGVGRMNAKVFSTYNIVGGIVWGGGVTMAGFLLGKRFPALGKRIELLSLVIIAISFLPIAYEFLKHRKAKANAAA